MNRPRRPGPAATETPGPLTSVPAEVPEGIARLLRPWLAQQRWFPRDQVRDGLAQWDSATVTRLGQNVEAWLLRTGSATVVHVPLVLVPRDPADAPDPNPPAPASVVPLPRPQPAVAPTPGLLGQATLAHGRTVDVFDGAWRAEAWRAVLLTAHWDRGALPVDVAVLESEPGPAEEQLRGRVLAGEQSNTSVLLPDVAGGLVLKLLRTVSEGDHPDCVVPRALNESGFTRAPHVPANLDVDVQDGQYLEGWPATLVVLSTLVPDADDGFTLACALASDGTDISAAAAELGETVADLHAAFRTAYPVEAGRLAAVPDEIAARLDEAADRSSEVRALLGPLDSYLDRLRRELRGREEQVVRQRIHGDLHLGQTLRAPSGWWILDFEGEPLRDPSDRIRPDLPERDLAGLLRSVDYAAAISASPDSDWATAARDGLITGYVSRTEHPEGHRDGQPAEGQPHTSDQHRTTTEILVDAFELDKAAYEVVYEEQHRPRWVPIPVAALHRLLAPFLS